MVSKNAIAAAHDKVTAFLRQVIALGPIVAIKEADRLICNLQSISWRTLLRLLLALLLGKMAAGTGVDYAAVT